MHNNNDAHTQDKSPNWWMRDNNDVHRKVDALIDEQWMLNNKSAQKIINALINERWLKHKEDGQKWYVMINEQWMHYWTDYAH